MNRQPRIISMAPTPYKSALSFLVDSVFNKEMEIEINWLHIYINYIQALFVDIAA
jgi:hypothetical protein